MNAKIASTQSGTGRIPKFKNQQHCHFYLEYCDVLSDIVETQALKIVFVNFNWLKITVVKS